MEIGFDAFSYEGRQPCNACQKEVRFASVNEFRKTLGDQAGQFSNKSEVDFRFAAMEEKVHTVMTANSEARGKSQGSNWLWGVLLGTLGIILTAITAVTLVITRTPHG